MRQLSNILILLLFSSTVFGQIKKKDILGEWHAKNDDSLYYKSDTITFFQNYNYFLNNGSKQLILWTINKKYFTIQDMFLTEPTRVFVSDDIYNLQLKKTDFGQLIEARLNKKIHERYKIIEYLGHEMKVMRFDDLSEQKLFNRVNFLIHNVLNYDSLNVDSTYQDIIKNTKSNNVKIRIRDGYDPNPEPLIVLNGYPIEDKEFLKRFRLVETIEIKCLKKDDLKFLYGTRAINGVIIISISNKRFKKE